MPNYSTIADQPTKNDLFDIASYIDGLSKFISTCQTPMTIAIQGDWGTGKTSIMEQVKDRFEDEKSEYSKSIIPTWFNTWQYSQFNQDNQLSLSLINSLSDSLSAKKPEASEKIKIKHTIKGLLKATLTSALNTYVPFVDGKAVVDSFDPVFEEVNKGLQDLKNEFQNLINKVTEKNDKGKRKKRIVFFIDDLDRLVPARAIELLEVLKLFLDCEGCVFVLAIDYNVVVRGVTAKYGKDIDAEKGAAFFEKIIQVPFTVPVSNYNMENFIKDSLEKAAKLKLENSDTNLVLDLIENSIGNNPRSMKRLFNSYSLLLYVAEANKESDWENKDKITLLSLLCLQHRYEEVYDYLVKQPTQDNLKGALNNLSKLTISNNEDDVTSLQKQLNLETISSRLIEFVKSFLELVNPSDKASENDLDKLITKLKLSNSVSKGNKDIQTNIGHKDFWEDFKKHLEQTSIGERYTLNSTGTREAYTISNKYGSGVQVEFRIRANKIAFVYTSKEKAKANTYEKRIIENLSKIKEIENSLSHISISKNEQNKKLGIECFTKSLNKNSDWTAIYEWFSKSFLEVENVVENI